MTEGKPDYSAEYTSETERRRYFTDLALRYLSLIKLHRESGHLPSLKNLSPEQIEANVESSGQKDWSSVIRHCLAEAGAVDAMARMLNFSKEDKENLIKAAILHDFDKRVEIEAMRANKENPVAAVEKVKLIGREILKNNGVKPEIIEIIGGIADLDIIHKDNVSLSQKILFYVDNITEGTNLVSVKDRHAALVKRYPKIMVEGGPYDNWVSSTEEVQKELAEKIGLTNPAELPEFILQKVKQLASEESGKK